MLFRVLRLVVFFLAASVLTIAFVFYFSPSSLVDVYVGQDEDSVLLKTKFLPIIIDISDTNSPKSSAEWSPSGRYVAYWDFVRLEWATKELALKIFDVRAFSARTIFIGDYHTSNFLWLSNGSVRVFASAGSGVVQFRDIDLSVNDPVIAVDDYDSGAWTGMKNYNHF